MTTAPSPAPAFRPSSAVSLPAHIVTASWYGAELNGRRTSSGETFNPNELTAVSRSLPIGSRLKVTDIANGRTVMVRINDRRPFVKGRSIDVSYAAADRIGLARRGVGGVQIEPVSDASAHRPAELSRVSFPARDAATVLTKLAHFRIAPTSPYPPAQPEIPAPNSRQSGWRLDSISLAAFLTPPDARLAKFLGSTRIYDQAAGIAQRSLQSEFYYEKRPALEV